MQYIWKTDTSHNKKVTLILTKAIIARIKLTLFERDLRSLKYSINVIHTLLSAH